MSDDQGIAGCRRSPVFCYERHIGQFLGITPESVAQVRDYTMVLGIPSLQTGKCLAASLIRDYRALLYKR
ncbi:hypothetical protein [Escherichia coli]|uniref:hypothetical protein n=1 Tax=Escherichia coli TaxID=562 RepID=UPI0022845EA6|nr:hypothetical protein [Escherichia coli]MCY9497261.1 hypothetical protein [Escherichia coli]